MKNAGRADVSLRRRSVLTGSQLLQSTCGFEQLLAVDVRIARDSREVCVPEVLSDEPGVAELLAEPGRRGVAQRVRGDVLLDPSALRGATDDVGEDRLLQPPTLEPAEDGVGRFGRTRGAQPPQLTREAPRQRLATRLVALSAADEQRRLCALRARGRAIRARTARNGAAPW